jgi:hypothetical protein
VAAADREGQQKDKITEGDTVGGRGFGRFAVHDQLLGGGWSGVRGGRPGNHAEIGAIGIEDTHGA